MPEQCVSAPALRSSASKLLTFLRPDGLGLLAAATLVSTLAACGGGDVSFGGAGTPSPPSITITNPTSFTTSSTITIGGSVSAGGTTSSVRVIGYTAQTSLSFNRQGSGDWYAIVYGLVPGVNTIIVVAEGPGGSTSAQINVSRPLQPFSVILNGPNRQSASTFWATSKHKVALFADGTGRSTTGTLASSEDPGPVTDFVWTSIAPDAILISSCSACAFQKISRITGSLDEALAYGAIETVDGKEAGLLGLTLTPGSL